MHASAKPHGNPSTNQRELGLPLFHQQKGNNLIQGILEQAKPSIGRKKRV